ncbi:divalent-cation tolerance protein CutA [Salinactinospora qingdaonensis]|uniref:Divalent-cation tolerance protein CutA n=1 Tax=Salinactinospora qingdaonensis TaxID=702744 RepID=A0ABP7F4N8_9ACTN
MTDQNVTEHMRVETTVADRDSAERLARSVIEARVAACAQVTGPITSFYRWEEEVHNDQEWLVVMKGAGDRLDALTTHLLAVHPYDVPEIIATPIEGGNPEYLRWVVEETRPTE